MESISVPCAVWPSKLSSSRFASSPTSPHLPSGSEPTPPRLLLHTLTLHILPSGSLSSPLLPLVNPRRLAVKLSNPSLSYAHLFAKTAPPLAAAADGWDRLAEVHIDVRLGEASISDSVVGRTARLAAVHLVLVLVIILNERVNVESGRRGPSFRIEVGDTRVRDALLGRSEEGSGDEADQKMLALLEKVGWDRVEIMLDGEVTSPPRIDG